MRKIMLVALLGMAAGCGVSKKEAEETLTGLEAIANAPDDMRTALLGSLCTESNACAGNCKDVMKAIGSADPKDRMLLVSSCDGTVKPLPESDARKAFDTWMSNRVGAYIKKVRGALADGDRARLDAAWSSVNPVR